MNNEFTRPPHRRGDTQDGPFVNAALLIDFDNVTMGIRSNLGQELRKLLDSDMIRGKVAVQRAYADWRRYPQYIVPLSESSIDLIFAPAYGSSKKNATDIRLAIDALELVFTRPEIGTFILLSGDSDFSSLVLKLKEYGKYVIGVGLQESSSDILVQNCDEYYSYNTLSGLTAAADMDHVKLDPWELAEKSLARMVERKDVMRSDRLKQVMLELDPSFDEKSAGFSKFNRFLAEAAHRGIINLRKAPNGQYEVGPVAGRSEEAAAADYAPPSKDSRDPPKESRSRPKESRSRPKESRSRARKSTSPDSAGDGRATPAWSASSGSEALGRAYRALAEAARELAKGRDVSVRDSEVKRRLLARDEGFDETALGFRKFSRFLQQARDEGIIDLEQRDDGNYYLRALEPAAGAAEAVAPPDREEARASSPARGRGTRRGRRGGRRDSVAAETPEVTIAPQPEAAEESQPEVSEVSEAPASESALRRGLDRFRRGSRGRTGPAAPSDGAQISRIGPIDEGPETTLKPTESETSRPPARAGSASTLPRGMGRRGGSRARAPSEAPTVNGTADSESADVGVPEERGKIIGHMIRNYSGVGRRTAERLVEEFGLEVFTVIDGQPDRVKQLLSKRQAQAVLDARDAERQR